MKFLIMILLVVFQLRAELVYISKIQSVSNKTIYMTKNKSLAQRKGLIIDLTRNRSKAKGKKNVWCLVRTKSEATLVVYITKNKSVGIPVYVDKEELRSPGIELGYGSDVELVRNNLLMSVKHYGHDIFCLPRVYSGRDKRNQKVRPISSKRNGPPTGSPQVDQIVFRSFPGTMVKRKGSDLGSQD
jgi:hypothetical protein